MGNRYEPSIATAMCAESSRSCDTNSPSRRRRRIVALIAISGCLFYIASSVLDSFINPTIDFDSYVPPNRFLLAQDLDGGPLTFNNPAAYEIMHRELKLRPLSKITLRRRSKEDTAELRMRQRQSAQQRTDRKLQEELAGLTPEIVKSVASTANAPVRYEDGEVGPIPPERMHNVSNYDVDSAILTSRAFQRELLWFVYDSATDDFVIIHTLNECDYGCKRAYVIAPFLARALRTNYPERFQGRASGDLFFLISVGDMPRVRRPCLFESSKYCKSSEWAPVLQFGSVMADPRYMPSVIGMPMSPRPHVPCFDEWMTTGEVCNDLRPRKEEEEEVATTSPGEGMSGSPEDLYLEYFFKPQAQDQEEQNRRNLRVARELSAGRTGKEFSKGLVFGESFMSSTEAKVDASGNYVPRGNYWDELIPQVVWRGTDFNFLHTLFPDMRTPTYKVDVQPKEGKFREGSDGTRDAIQAIRDMGEDSLTPRWKGVLLTSEAELESRELQEKQKLDGQDPRDAPLPWVNIKFASYADGSQKLPATENPDYRILRNRFGVDAIGNPMSMDDHIPYKYHIDLGGGGGTTWTGTIEKLALPGVLFHHVTPTKDWIHDHIKPWVHYIPVSQDLRDLREKFEWAEANPEEAQKIAERGTEFARYIGTPEGFAALYQEHIVAPLGNIIRNYRPPSQKRYKPASEREQTKRILSILKDRDPALVSRLLEEHKFTVVARCGGWPGEVEGCRWTMKEDEKTAKAAAVAATE